MVNIAETRFDASNNSYVAIIPIDQAGEVAYSEHVAETVREYLFRQGLPQNGLTDAQLLARLARTFAVSRRPL